MKKNKKTMKKLSLNKKVVSNLEKGQVTGGTFVTIVNCPIRTTICPTRFNCPTRLFCPSFGNCPSIVDGCGSALGCI